MMLKRRKTADIREDDLEGFELPLDPDGIKNVVVFGESGVGKSSLINLIADERVCETSSGALGCTLEYQRHVLKLGTPSQYFSIWDTAGLDEGSEGTVPAEKAEAYLKLLLHELTRNHGVDLLIYCVRGTRVRSALLANYHVFYSAICRRKVPIAIVITGLENQEGEMETWWSKNESQFSSFKMHFDNHACVTTIEPSVENAILKKRREQSREVVIRMIANTCRSQHWNPPKRSWVETAFPDIRAMLSPKEGSNECTPTIIMCDVSRDCAGSRLTRERSVSFQNPIQLSLSLNSVSFRSPVSISTGLSLNKFPFEDGMKRTPDGRRFRVFQVPRGQVPTEGTEEGTKKVTVIKRGADLLIFCVKMEETEAGIIKFQWEHFNTTYSGDLSPQIVVVVGASDQASAEEWWKHALGGAEARTGAKDGVGVAYWPMNIDTDPRPNVELAQRRLRHLISDRCIDCRKVKFTRNEQFFRRSVGLDMSNLTTLWTKPDSVGKENGPPSGGTPEQDILTRLGVWEDVPESGQSTSPMQSPTEFEFLCQF